MAGKKSADAGAKLARKRKERKFPSLTFQEALALAEAVQKYAAGQKVRRLTLFEKLDQSPDNSESRKLITASGQYGLTKGSYASEHLELTAEGKEATDEEVAHARKLSVRFNLAIKNHPPFNLLYEKIKGNKMPAKEVMGDYLSDADIEEDEKAECIDTLILNAKFLGLLRTIAGSERLIPIEQAIEEVPEGPVQTIQAGAADNGLGVPKVSHTAHSETSEPTGDFAKTCFYNTDWRREFRGEAACRLYDVVHHRASGQGVRFEGRSCGPDGEAWNDRQAGCGAYSEG